MAVSHVSPLLVGRPACPSACPLPGVGSLPAAVSPAASRSTWTASHPDARTPTSPGSPCAHPASSAAGTAPTAGVAVSCHSPALDIAPSTRPSLRTRLLRPRALAHLGAYTLLVPWAGLPRHVSLLGQPYSSTLSCVSVVVPLLLGRAPCGATSAALSRTAVPVSRPGLVGGDFLPGPLAIPGPPGCSLPSPTPGPRPHAPRRCATASGRSNIGPGPLWVLPGAVPGPPRAALRARSLLAVAPPAAIAPPFLRHSGLWPGAGSPAPLWVLGASAVPPARLSQPPRPGAPPPWGLPASGAVLAPGPPLPAGSPRCRPRLCGPPAAAAVTGGGGRGGEREARRPRARARCTAAAGPAGGEGGGAAVSEEA